MKVFISHSYQDGELARLLSDELAKRGLRPWLAESEIYPGDNWGEVIGRALKESEAMVGVVTPLSGASPQVRQELGYALTNRSYEGRVIPLIVGDRGNLPQNAFPWILNRYRVVQIPSAAFVGQAAEQIVQALQMHMPASA